MAADVDDLNNQPLGGACHECLSRHKKLTSRLISA
jgi:hypothetical protein